MKPLDRIKLFELSLAPKNPESASHEFEIEVIQSEAGEAKVESFLPFYEGQTDWRITLIKVLEQLTFSHKDFPRPAEQDWMVRAGILKNDRSSFHPKFLDRIGKELYRALLPEGKVKEAFIASLRIAERENVKLHIRLRFQASEMQNSHLADYPWELLHDGQDFLARRQVVFSRYVAHSTTPPNLKPAERVNVLLVSSTAFDEEQGFATLNRSEQQAICQGLDNVSQAKGICLDRLQAATQNALRRYLTEHTGNDTPHVLHFDGHGLYGKRCDNLDCRAIHFGIKVQRCRICNQELPSPQGYLMFENEAGGPDYISAIELGTLLRQASFSDRHSSVGIPLVVLTACRSAMAVEGDSAFNGIAQNLISHRVPAVVAMQYSVTVAAAAQFVEQFYRSLGQKNSLALAVSQGREAMGAEGNQWYRPVLYLRWRDNEGGHLFAFASVDQSETKEGDDKVYFRIPPKGKPPIGRQKELKLYLQQLFDIETRSIFITGLAGIGKTTLGTALYYLMLPDSIGYRSELVHDSLPTQHVSYAQEQMVWADLTENDSSEGFLAACAETARARQALDTESILLSQSHKLSIKLDVLAEFLDHYIQVIFLDDFHKVKDESLIGLLLKDLLKRLKHTKLVYMSRRKFLIDYESESLKGLDDDASLYLLRQLVTSFVFSDEQVIPLIRKYDGHPEALKLIAALLKRRKTPEGLLKRLSATWDDPQNGLRELLKTLFADLSPQHQEMASSLAVFRNDVTEDLTDNLCMSCKIDVQKIIWDLQEYFVLELKKGFIIENNDFKAFQVLQMHDLVKDYCYEVSKDRHSQLHQNALETWIKILPTEISRLVGEAAQPAWPFFPEGWDKQLLSKNQTMPHLQQLEILLEAFYHAPLANNDAQWTALLFIVDRYLHRWGMMEELMKHIEQLETNTASLVPQLKFRKARILNEWHRGQEALSILLPMLEEDWSITPFSENDQFLIPTVVYAELGAVYGNLQASDKAIENYQIALDRFIKLGEAKGLSRTYALLGDEYTKIGRYEAAKENYYQAHKLNIDNEQWYYAALNLRRLGDVSFLSGDLNAARVHLDESRRLVEAHSIANQDGADYARIRFSLAKVLLASEPELVDLIRENLSFAAQVFDRQRLDAEKLAVDEILATLS